MDGVCQDGHWLDCAPKFALANLTMCFQSVTKNTETHLKAAFRLLSFVLLSFTRHPRGESARSARMSYTKFFSGKDHGTYSKHLQKDAAWTTFGLGGKRCESDQGRQR